MHREADSNNGPTQALTSVLPSMPFESWPAGQVVHESLPTALYVFTGQAAHKKGEKKTSFVSWSAIIVETKRWT